ncbi:N-acetyltransferase [Viridibacillus arvi]|nr:N-acetyltransferase [Viridibacillus arvi]
MKITREATSLDMKVVYMMGYDVWGGDLTPKEYVTMCNDSSKYKRGKWYVIEETDTKELLSSLIVYELNPSENLIVRGIGSIATPLHLRHNGYASILIKEVINELEKNDNCNNYFLFSDINTDFYKKLNFIELQPSKQKYKDSICMYYSKENDIDSINYEIPNYF